MTRPMKQEFVYLSEKHNTINFKFIDPYLYVLSVDSIISFNGVDFVVIQIKTRTGIDGSKIYRYFLDLPIQDHIDDEYLETVELADSKVIWDHKLSLGEDVLLVKEIKWERKNREEDS